MKLTRSLASVLALTIAGLAGALSYPVAWPTRVGSGLEREVADLEQRVAMMPAPGVAAC